MHLMRREDDGLAPTQHQLERGPQQSRRARIDGGEDVVEYKAVCVGVDGASKSDARALPIGQVAAALPALAQVSVRELLEVKIERRETHRLGIPRGLKRQSKRYILAHRAAQQEGALGAVRPARRACEGAREQRLGTCERREHRRLSRANCATHDHQLILCNGKVDFAVRPRHHPS